MMKNLLRKMIGWTNEMRLNLKHKIKRLLLDLKRFTSKVPTASIVFILALVFTMAYSSYVIFASDSDTVTYNGKSYSRYKNGTYQYVTFGSFPKDLADGTEGLPDWNDYTKDGQVHEITEGANAGKYLYELNTSGVGHWYKFAPITWQILDVDDTRGGEKLLLLSESCLESRTWDTQTSTHIIWDGTNGAGLGSGRHAYPAIRMYLNSYDCTDDKNNTANTTYTSTDNKARYSKCEYTPDQFTKFYDKGFLEKAFSEIEIEKAIIPDHNEFTYSSGTASDYYNVTTDIDDKVRLLSLFEMEDKTNPNNNNIATKFGFASSINTQGLDSNRLGFVTDYSASKNTTNTSNYQGAGTTQYYYTKSRNSTSIVNVVSNVGKSGTVYIDPGTAQYAGIRPLISVSLKEINNLSGNGTLESPYELKGKEPDPNDLINKVKPYFEDDNKGFINYGSFPQRRATLDEIIALDSICYSPIDGQVYEITEGENKGRYLYESDYFDPKEAHWYKFEPIKWQILSVDKNNNSITVMTESCIDSRAYDTQMKTKVLLWDGTTNGITITSTSSGKNAYPSLRLYLNSYDSTELSYDYFSSSSTNEVYSYSSLTYTEKDASTTPFDKIGFLQKAFTDSERESIIPSTSKYSYTAEDGTAENIKDSSGKYDKVRILSSYEISDSGNPNNSNCGSSYGFAANPFTGGVDSNRLGFITDYSFARYGNYQNFKFTHDTNANSSYTGWDSTSERYGRRAIKWWTKSRANYGSSYYVDYDGNAASNNSILYHYGIRPVMTISLNDLMLESGEGSWEEPFGLKEKPIDPEVKPEDFGTYFEDPSHGYVYFGSFPKDDVTSSMSSVLTSQFGTLVEGKVYEIPDGTNKGKYLYQNSKVFKFEDIKWQILKVDSSNNKILLLSESVLESRTWDTQTPTVYWVGSTEGTGDNIGKLRYPSLRLYLNSYDSTMPSYSYSSSRYGESYSYLKYTEHPDREFYEQGFLEKAFTGVERDAILNDNSEYINIPSLDLDYEIGDKVRLLTREELFTNGPNYGFASGFDEIGLESNRMGFTTDYSKEKVRSGDILNSYPGYNGRDTQSWYLRSYAGFSSGNKMPLTIKQTAESGSEVATTFIGVRPVISLDLSRLTKSAGKGSLSKPYKLEATPVLPIGTNIDDNTFTKWFENDANGRNHGFVYFGRYANSIVTSAEAEALNLPSSPIEGKVYTSSVDGNEYEYENKWCRIEPIKWMVLTKKKGSNNEDQLVLLSESSVDFRYYDLQSNTIVRWDGTGGSEGTGENAGKHSYPGLRLWLNSYDCSKEDYEVIATPSLRVEVFSSLTYTDRFKTDDTIKYKHRGFLAKAFTDSERASIVPDIPIYSDPSTDGDITNYKDSNGKYDKVRLLTYEEVAGSHASEFGFISGESQEAAKYGWINPYSNQWGSMTSYNPYSDNAKIRRRTQDWWLLSNYTYYPTNFYFRMVNGYGGVGYASFAYNGVRPVITLDVSNISIDAGDGSAYSPYMLNVSGPSEIYTEELTTDGEIKYYPDGYLDEEGVLHNDPGDVEVLTGENHFSGINVYIYSNDMVLLEGESDGGAFLYWTAYHNLNNKKAAIANSGLKLSYASELFDETSKTNKCLEKVDLTNFDSSSLTETWCMFDGCKKLESITFPSNFDTSKVDDFEMMFDDCESLEELDLSTFVIAYGASTMDMFSGCTNLTEIKIPQSVDTGSEPELPGSNWGVYKADGTKLDDVTKLPGKNTYPLGSYVKSTAPKLIYTDPDDPSIKYYDTDATYAWDISETGDGGVMAYYFAPNASKGYDGEVIITSTNPNNKTIKFHGSLYEDGSWYEYHSPDTRTSTPIYISHGPEDIPAGKTIGDYLTTRGFVNADECFHNVTPWSILQARGGYDVKHFYVADEFTLDECGIFFADLNKVEDIKIDKINTSNATNFIGMFLNDKSLKNIDISNFDFTNAIEMGRMFENCNSLEEITFPEEKKTSTSLTSMNEMFSNCFMLEDVDLSTIDTSHVGYVNNMFFNCVSLTDLNLSNNTFANNLDISNWFTTTNNVYEFARYDYCWDDYDLLDDDNKTSCMEEYQLSYMPPFESKLETITFNDDSAIEIYRGDVYAFFGLHSLETLDLSSFKMSSGKKLGESDFWYTNSLNTIILPTKTTDTTLKAELPVIEGYTWVGYNGDTKVGDKYTYLPLNPNGGGLIDRIKLEENIIVINAGTENEKTYKVLDALYKWDISEAGDKSVMAYYFAKDTTKGYDGEVVIYTDPLRPASKTVGFTDYYTFDEKNNTAKATGTPTDPEPPTVSTYEDVLSTERGFIFNSLSYKYTPWSILTTFQNLNPSDTNYVKKFVIANQLNLSSGQNFFAYQDNLEEIEGIENINTTGVTYMRYMFLNAPKLDRLDLSNFDFSQVTTFDNLLNNFYTIEDYREGQWSYYSGNEALLNIFTADFAEKNASYPSEMKELIFSKDQTLQLGASNDHILYGLNSLEKITLPGSTNSIGVILPKVDGYKWIGYKEDNKVGGVYKTLPTWSAEIDNIRLVEDIITVGEGTDNEKNFKVLDATYAWDISEAGDGSVMAYYFAKDTTKGYDGELIFNADNASCKAMEFKAACYSKGSSKYSFDSGSYINIATTDDIASIIASGTRNFIYGTYNISITPWSLFENYDTNANNNINHVIVASPFKLKEGNYFFDGLVNAKDVDASKLNMQEATGASYMFGHLTNASLINSGNIFATNSIADMNSMFDSCQKITNIDFSNVDFSSATSIYGLVRSCDKLQSVTFNENLDTSSVTNMGQVFYGCKALTSVNLSGFDTASVTRFDDMFNYCTSLTLLDLSSFDINVTSSGDVSSFIQACSALKSIKLPTFGASTNADTINCLLPSPASDSNWIGYKDGTKVGGAYTKLVGKSSSVNELRQVKTAIKINEGQTDEKTYNTADALYEWDISEDGNGGVIAYYFNGTGAVSGNTYDGEVLIYTAIPGSKVMRFNSYIKTWGPIISPDAWNLDLSEKITLDSDDVDALFGTKLSQNRGFANLDNNRAGGELDTYTPWSLLEAKDVVYETNNTPVKKINIANDLVVGDTNVMFACLPNLVSIDLSHLISTTTGENQTTSMYYMFASDKKLKSIVFPQTFNTSKVVNMARVFNECEKLETIDIRYFDSTSVKNAGYMFFNCYKLSSLTYSDSFTLASCEIFGDIFESCQSLETIDISKWNTSNAKDLSYMFCGCSKLKTLETGENFKAVKGTIEDIEGIFSYNDLLEKVDLSGFDLSGIDSYDEVFESSPALNEIILPISVPTNGNISLPTKSGKVWRGYLGTNKTSETYKYLPAKSASVDRLELVDFSIVCGDKEFKPVDAKYKWDISEAGDKSVMAYYFAPNLLKGYDGEVVIYTDLSKPTSKTMPFTDVYWFDYFDNMPKAGVTLAELTESTYQDFLKDERKFQSVFIDDVRSITPWSILTAFQKTNADDHDLVKKFVIANKLNLKYANTFFAYLDNLTDIEGIENINTEDATAFALMFTNTSKLKKLDLSNFDFDDASSEPQRNILMLNNMWTVDDFIYIYFGTEPDDTSRQTYQEVYLQWRASSQSELEELVFSKDHELGAIANEVYLLQGLTSLSKITLPGGTGSTQIKLPNVDGYKWTGYKDDDIVGGVYKTLPTWSAEIDNIRLVEDVIEVNGKTFKPVDAKYIWDVSSDGSETILAYYFDGTTNKDGNPTSREYQGELVFYSFDDNKSVIPFNDFAFWMSGEKTVGYGKMFTDSLTSMYGPIDTILSGRGFINGGKVITPWSVLLDDTGINPVQEVVVANNLNLTSCEKFFAGLNSVKKITGIENINTTNLDLTNSNNVEKMFCLCENLEGTLDLSSLDLTNAKSMNKMFEDCMKVEHIIFNENKTISNVTDMNSLFSGCKSLIDINLSKFNTASTLQMQYMFSRCESLNEITFGDNFTTRSVTDIQSMFKNCKSLIALDLSTFDIQTRYLTDFIKGCEKLSEIKLPASIKEGQVIPLEAGDKSYWMGYNETDVEAGKQIKLSAKASGTLTKVKLIYDNTSPVVTKVEADKSTFGPDKDITLTVSLSEELDVSNFASINKDNVYIKVNFGGSESVIKLDSYGLHPSTGDFVLIFKGKTPNISDEGEFKLTGMTLVNDGESLIDLAGNNLDTSSLTQTIWKSTLSNLEVNTTGFPIEITAKDYQEATIQNGGETHGDTITYIIDFHDAVLDPAKTESEILDLFKLEIKNNNEDKRTKNKAISIKDAAGGGLAIASVTLLGIDKYEFSISLADCGDGTHFIDKDDYLGYTVTLGIEKGALTTANQVNIKTSHTLKVVKQMEEHSVTATLKRDGMDDKELVFNKQRQRFEDGNGNEVKFLDGDKIELKSPEGSKIVYKQDGTGYETPSNSLVINIDKQNPEKPFEEIGSYKDGYSINPNDLLRINIDFIKLIIVKEGTDAGGTVTPLGNFDIETDDKEIEVTVNADYRADIYRGNSFIKSLNASGTYLVEGLKKLLTDLTVRVKFVSTKKPDPAPSGGGGGGGGGPIFTILPEEPKMGHKAYMNGYNDKTFRPNDKVTREEVATIVARLDSEFNEDYNFTGYNTFSDANDKWSKNYIGFCKMKDLIHGYEDGSFHPSSYMTRAELATLVSNFLRVQNADFSKVDLTKPRFSDIDGRWYEEAVNKLAALGILNGYEDGTFKGDNPVTRIEVAIVMNKINHRTITEEIPDEYIKKVTSMFKDVTSDRWFFKDVVEATVDHPEDLF